MATFKTASPRLSLNLALRINKNGNMPQPRFNEDGEWHNFAPEGGTGLKAGPWFPYLMLYSGDCLSDNRVNHPTSEGAQAWWAETARH